MTLLKIASKVSRAITLTALPIAVLTALPKVSEAASFSNLYVFGDSLSDVGNTLNATKSIFPLPDAPAYSPGRFSNGPVWVENLATQLGKSVTTENNFAVGGARTGTDNELNPLFSPLGVTLPGLQQQIDSFKAKNSKADGDALYILWAGANDYLNEQLNLADPVVAQTTINTAVSNLGNAITHLAKIGAKNFLIPNLADLGKLPQTNKNPIVAGGLGLITQSHNDALSQLLKSLPLLNPDSGLNLMSLDVFSLVNQAIADPNSGFTNTTDACLNVPLPFFTGNCSNPDQYLFWDNLHPTAREHQKISDLAYSVLHSKVPPGKSVPEGSAALGVLVVGVWLGAKSLRRQKLSKRRSPVPVAVD